MDGRELMQTSHPAEAEHRTRTSPQWQVAVLGSVVDPAARGLAAAGVYAQFAQRRAIGLQLVGDDGRGLAMPFQQFSQQFQCRFAIKRLRNDRVQHLAFVIDGASKVD